jgi:L-fucose isomerase-like protein
MLDSFIVADKRNQAYSGVKSKGKNRLGLGTMAVWLSSISALIYFLTSYGMKNYTLSLIEIFKKSLEVFFK